MLMFNAFDLGTSSYCNRRCPSCMRNSWPDKAESAHLFKQAFMPMEMIDAAFKQVVDTGYRGRLCLAHWNEPLLDPRIVEIAKLAKSYKRFSVYLATNADYLTPELASKLEGVLSMIRVSLYGDCVSKADEIRRMFKKTRVLVRGMHNITHFSPLGRSLADLPCIHVVRRLIIDHAGRYLLCCDDLVGSFDLGTFPDVSVKDYWFGEKHQKIIETLGKPGGRRAYPHCETCPVDFACMTELGRKKVKVQ